MAALSLLELFPHFQFYPLCLIPLAAGIGILRRRVWPAYGYALILIAQTIAVPSSFASASATQKAALIGAVLFQFGIATLLFSAGRALSKNGAPRGVAWPWIVLACALSFPFLFWRPYKVTAGSMENTLLAGDDLLVRTFPKPSLQRDDLVVFRYPADETQIYVKRIAGIGGDRLHIANGILYRNGQPVNEPYVIHNYDFGRGLQEFPSPAYIRSDDIPGVGLEPLRRNRLQRDMLQNHLSNGEIVVPAGMYFVLGDSRDNSLDSRYHGFVSENEIIGKPFFIYDSTVTPRRIRWNRVFKPI